MCGASVFRKYLWPVDVSSGNKLNNPTELELARSRAKHVMLQILKATPIFGQGRFLARVILTPANDRITIPRVVFDHLTRSTQPGVAAKCWLANGHRLGVLAAQEDKARLERGAELKAAGRRNAALQFA